MIIVYKKKGTSLITAGICHTWRHSRTIERARAEKARAEQEVEIRTNGAITARGSWLREGMARPNVLDDWSYGGYQPRASRKGSSARTKRSPDSWKQHRQSQYRAEGVI